MSCIRRQFLKVLLNSQPYHAALLAQQKGMDIPHLSKSEILEPIVAVPPVEEQRRISAISDTYDTRIRTEEAYRDKLKLQKKGLMHDLEALEFVIDWELMESNYWFDKEEDPNLDILTGLKPR